MSPPRGIVVSPPHFLESTIIYYMQSYIKELKEKGLVPLRLDNNTVLFVPPEKANEKYKAHYLKNAERSRRMALNLG